MENFHPNNYVVIMAGGSGTRFWPISRKQYPKQFLDILNTGKTLLQDTYDRYASYILPENIYVITAKEYAQLVEIQLPTLSQKNIVVEPVAKNTAPCILYMANKLYGLNPNANMVVAPSDHFIQDATLYKENCMKALETISKDKVFITLGIKPTHPNTGYGYIHYKNRNPNQNTYEVINFTEKPNHTRATQYLETGEYLWNAGIFIWKAKDILEAFSIHMEKMYETFQQHVDYLNTDIESEVMEKVYNHLESISIDYAIMEKIDNVQVVPAAFRWSDLGTWNSLWSNSPKDEYNNALLSSNAIALDSKDCLVHSQSDKLIVLYGLENIIVVNTEDTLLICPKSKDQEIKQIIDHVLSKKGKQYQ